MQTSSTHTSGFDYSHLNEAQQNAVATTEGPLLVLAGAGTGKTRVLTTRIVNILAQNLAFPYQILAVTFTNKAAREMKDRVETMIGPVGTGIWLGTFHSLCLRILRKHAELLGFEKNFTIIDADDQTRLIKTIIKDMELDDKEFPAASALNMIQRWKDQALTHEQVAARMMSDEVINIYERYQTRMQTLGVMDFSDLLLHCITLFQKHPDVLEHYQNQFRYVLVDEYQDTNVAQYMWLRMLAEAHKNICCVGDEDQSIYGWRGAEITNILRFESDFSTDEKPAEVIRLEENYRSTPSILGVASHVIANNTERLGKTLYSQNEAHTPVRVVNVWNDRAEASYAAQEIESLQHNERHKLDEIAILLRAGYQTRAFEEEFIAQQIPYRVVGGLRFYERKEIKDAIAYMRVIAQYSNDLALERIINLPKRGIGAATLDKLRFYAATNNIPLYEAIGEQLEQKLLKGKAGQKLAELMAQFERWRDELLHRPHAEVIDQMLEESGYLAMWQQENTLEAKGRLENLEELITALETFENLEAFLEHVSLISDLDSSPEGDMVNIMTIHSAKGLEFDSVFLGGWEEGLFPSQRSLDETGNKGLEEERRLAYVAITRARKNLWIMFANSRFLHGKIINSLPSRFLAELPNEHIERINLLGQFAVNQTQFTPQKQNWAGTQRESNTPSKPHKSYAKSADGLDTGCRVFHQKFGYGRIMKRDGGKATVAFEKSSERTLMVDYLEKAERQ